MSQRVYTVIGYGDNEVLIGIYSTLEKAQAVATKAEQQKYDEEDFIYFDVIIFPITVDEDRIDSHTCDIL